MDQVGKLIPVLVAACFVYATAFLFGKLSGTGNGDLLWYLTFSDIVNNAPGLAASIGLSLIVNCLNVVESPFKFSRRTQLLLLIFFFSVLLLVSQRYEWILWPTVFIFSIYQALAAVTDFLQPQLKNAVGETTGRVATRAIRLIWVPMAFGYLLGATMVILPSSIIVCTNQEMIRSTGQMALERGLVVFRNSGFLIIPWSMITKIEEVPGGSKKPDKDLASVCKS
jgi:hypothetical protein